MTKEEKQLWGNILKWIIQHLISAWYFRRRLRAALVAWHRRGPNKLTPKDMRAIYDAFTWGVYLARTNTRYADSRIETYLEDLNKLTKQLAKERGSKRDQSRAHGEATRIKVQ